MVDEFLLEKIRKKLEYWSVVHLLLARRGVSINSIVISFLLFLFSVGGVQEGSEQMQNTYMKLFMVKKWTYY